MKNLFLSLAFMLVGTFAFASNSIEVEKELLESFNTVSVGDFYDDFAEDTAIAEVDCDEIAEETAEVLAELCYLNEEATKEIERVIKTAFEDIFRS